MALTEQPTRAATRELSASLFVAVTARGLVVPPIGDHPAIDLSLADLSLLAALVEPAGARVGALVDAVAGATGADPAALAATAAALDERGRLVPVGDRQGRPAKAARWSSAPVTGPPDEAPSGAPPQPAGTDRWVLRTPFLARPVADGLEVCDHDGEVVLVLAPVEAVAATAFGWPTALQAAHAAHVLAAGDQALAPAAFGELAVRLHDAGLLVAADDGELPGLGGVQQIAARELERLGDLVAVCDREADRRRHDRAARRAAGATARPLVVPYGKNTDTAPLALGMLLAAIGAHDGGRLLDQYELEPDWVVRRPRLRALLDEGPMVLLLSNYVWSHQENLKVAAMVKGRSPDSLVVCGGPDTPAYPGDCEAYLRAHPEVDVVVRGEGEATVVEVLDALGGQLVGRGDDLSVLADVAGLAFRHGDEVVRTADRPRITDLGALPSPYLSGVFDAFGEATVAMAIIETNRGCPYGCTFCDWGSATRSRIRQFPLDRVLAEIEWLGRHRIPRVFFADANFGILERDVEITEHLARVKATYGFPVRFQTSFAKNTIKHTRHIVEVLVGAGLITEASLSLQTVDEATLAAVNRSNIRTDKYRELAAEFRRAGLPLYTDLMMGLPGSTTASFRGDLQDAIDHELPAKIYRTELIVNSPMNEPSYREQHQLRTEGKVGQNLRALRPIVVASTTFTREDHREMERLRRTFTVADNYGVLRLVSRYARHELGLPEADWYADLDRRARDEREALPHLAWFLESGPDLLAPPGSWRHLLADVRLDLVGRGVADDAALDAVLDAQLALLPAPGRRFPVSLALPHDVGAWHAAMVRAKDDGDAWSDLVPALRTFGPGPFVVDDPQGLSAAAIGFGMEDDLFGVWELASPVARPTVPRFERVD